MTTALVVSRYFPLDSQRVTGAYQRLGTQVQALAKVVDRVDCLFLLPVQQHYTPEVIQEHEQRLRRLWSPRVSIRLAPTLTEDEPPTLWQRLGRGVFDFQAQPIARPANTEAAVGAVSAALDARPDIVLAHRLSSMCVLMALARLAPEKTHRAPLFFDMDDIEHVAWFRRLVHDPGWPAERLQLLQVPRLMLAEIQAVRLATATFVCSMEDRRYLARFVGRDRVLTVANSVTFPPAAADASDPLVLFVGFLGYRPNALAVDVLVQQIWPAVHARVPEARLVIIGGGAELSAAYPSRDPSVTFTGFVDDLDEWYRRARVVCCPIYHGAGTRVKIIEAAAYGKAIVSTRLGAEGLDLEDGREIVLCDTPSDLSDGCVRLLRHAGTAGQMGIAAREKARITYDRGVVIERLVKVFTSDCGNNNTSGR